MSYCARCLDDFRYDDTGGYNPPARCQEHCRNCCEGDCMDEPIHLDDDDHPYDCCCPDCMGPDDEESTARSGLRAEARMPDTNLREISDALFDEAGSLEDYGNEATIAIQRMLVPSVNRLRAHATALRRLSDAGSTLAIRRAPNDEVNNG